MPMLYIRAVDDAAVTHAITSLTEPAPLCRNPQGRIRLDPEDYREYDPLTSTATNIRKPVPVSRPADVTCPECAARLAPRKIRARALAPAPLTSAQQESKVNL